MHTAYAAARRRATIKIISAFLILVICTALAANRHISSVEAAILNRVYDLPTVLNEVMYAITQMGSAGAAVVVVVAALALKRHRLAVLLAVNATLAYIVTTILKNLVMRPRPAELLPEIVVRMEQASGYGFPSGHTALATTLALTLLPYTTKRYRWLLWLWIAAVGVSRMYLGVHAPLDIIGGVCIGVIIASSSQLVLYQRQSKQHPLKPVKP